MTTRFSGSYLNDFYKEINGEKLDSAQGDILFNDDEEEEDDKQHTTNTKDDNTGDYETVYFKPWACAN